MPANRDKLETKTPPPEVQAQLAAPVVENHIADGDITAQYLAMPEADRDRAKLRELRRGRTTSERMDRLEDKHDDVVADVTQIRADVGEMKGSLKGMAGSLERLAKREDNEADVAKAKAIAEVKAEVKDKLDKRTSRRKLVMRILGGVATVVAIAIAHKLLQTWVPWL